MEKTGLNNRLRQHSRRAGLAVGLSMALTILICVGLPVVIYAQLNPFAADFIAADLEDEPRPTATRQAREVAEDESSDDESTAPDPTQPAEVEEVPTEPPPTSTPSEFTPDLVVSSDGTPVNIRAEPNVNAEVLNALPNGTELQSTGERADEPGTGNVFLEIKTEDGQQGWIYEYLTDPIDGAG